MRSGATSRSELLNIIADLRAQLAVARDNLPVPQVVEVFDRTIANRNTVLPCVNDQELPSEKVDSAISVNISGRFSEDSVRLYQQIFFHAKEGIGILDSGGRIIEQNAAHRAMLGYPDEELIGKTPADYLENGLDAFGRTMDDLLQWGSYCGGVRCRTRSGSWIDTELSIAIIRNESLHILGYTILVYDVTEKKRMEDALRESEARFTTFMNNSSVVAFMRDADGRYVYINRAFENYVGKRSGEVLGKTAFDIWPTEIAEQLTGTDERVLAVGRAMELYERTELPGRGTKEWLAIKFPFLDRRGNMLVGCVSIDVTERKSLEDQLRQSQKMEAVGRLAGGIAHDFNNLLTIINGYSDLLVNSPGINEDHRARIEEVKKAGDRAALLTRQLLAFSRRQVLTPQVLDLNTVIEGLRKMIERLIGEDIAFLTIPHDPLDMVKADPGQVEQIIMNLIVNARDAMPHGGKLTIETANVEFDEVYSRAHVPCQPGHYVMIAVSDTGTGMDRETQRHIFEPFFTTKESGKGTGLGLATVYGIVKQSGGFVWVYSEEGVGTTFKIYFPRVLEQVQALVVNRVDPGELRGTETILVAEDEEALRLLICEALQQYGYNVLEAADGQDAVRLSERYALPIHLLIADVVMPQMSGRKLAERITAARPGVGVLYISGYTDEAIVRHGVLDPNTAFLQKPFSPGTLARRVRLLLSHRSIGRS